MAGREKKQVGNKQLVLKKEADRNIESCEEKNKINTTETCEPKVAAQKKSGHARKKIIQKQKSPGVIKSKKRVTEGSGTVAKANPAGDTSLMSAPLKCPPNAKLRKSKFSRLSLGSLDGGLRNGTKGRSVPYLTRSSPVRLLRNGKRRKLNDNIFDVLEVGFPKKRRRLMSSAKDGIPEIESNLCESSQLENGGSHKEVETKSIISSVNELKIEGTTNLSQEIASSPCTERDQKQASGDNSLGKSISNKIAELIKRGKLQEIKRKSSVEEELVTKVGSHSSEKHSENSLNIECENRITDSNSNVYQSEEVIMEKSFCVNNPVVAFVDTTDTKENHSTMLEKCTEDVESQSIKCENNSPVKQSDFATTDLLKPEGDSSSDSASVSSPVIEENCVSTSALFHSSEANLPDTTVDTSAKENVQVLNVAVTAELVDICDGASLYNKSTDLVKLLEQEGGLGQKSVLDSTQLCSSLELLEKPEECKVNEIFDTEVSSPQCNASATSSDMSELNVDSSDCEKDPNDSAKERRSTQASACKNQAGLLPCVGQSKDIKKCSVEISNSFPTVTDDDTTIDTHYSNVPEEAANSVVIDGCQSLTSSFDSVVVSDIKTDIICSESDVDNHLLTTQLCSAVENQSEHVPDIVCKETEVQDHLPVVVPIDNGSEIIKETDTPSQCVATDTDNSNKENLSSGINETKLTEEAHQTPKESESLVRKEDFSSEVTVSDDGCMQVESSDCVLVETSPSVEAVILDDLHSSELTSSSTTQCNDTELVTINPSHSGDCESGQLSTTSPVNVLKSGENTVDSVCSETRALQASEAPKERNEFAGENRDDEAKKETILSALGLQSLRAAQANAAAAASRRRQTDSSYTGTLKAVIKLQRTPEKRAPEKRTRNPLRLVLKQGKAREGVNSEGAGLEGQSAAASKFEYRICKEATSSQKEKDVTDSVMASKKCLKPSNSYRTFFDISSSPQFLMDKEGSSDAAVQDAKDDGKTPTAKQSANLVIPEKSSSFSIHPGRLCSDVCSYCFGKFGSLDTPCHIAQLKNAERQCKILEAETHLTADSCLCDACYRHVDRKANCPSYQPNRKRVRSSEYRQTCCVQRCAKPAQHHVRRKWLMKLKRSIAKKVPIDMDKMPQHLPFPLCTQHYYWVDYFMVCGICKRRLTRNHMYPLGSEVHELNTALTNDGIPVRLSENLFLCKLCRYFGSLRLKYKTRSQLGGNHKLFFESYRKRILHYHNIEVLDSQEVDEPLPIPPKIKRRKTKASATNSKAENFENADKSKGEFGRRGSQNSSHQEDEEVETSDSPGLDYSGFSDSITELNRSGAGTPMIDYSSLGNPGTCSNVESLDATSLTPLPPRKMKMELVKPTKIRLRLGNIGVSKVGQLSASQPSQRNTAATLQQEAPQTSAAAAAKSVYPGQEQLPLDADFKFHEKVDNGSGKVVGWEKCTANIQFNRETKQLFQELKEPYGNHSSFFRHLVLLEKYWRSGDLVLSPNASLRAANYVQSVQNRISAFGGHNAAPAVVALNSSTIITTVSSTPLPSVPVIDLPLRRRVNSGIMSSQPVTITPVSSPSYSSKSAATSTAPKQIIINSVPKTLGGNVQSKRVPNIVQLTGAKSFSYVQNIKPLRIKQFKQQDVNQPSTSSSTQNFGPLICDVRSLASEKGNNIWDKNIKIVPRAKTSQFRRPKVTILPKTSTPAMTMLRPGLKPSTVVTPTGIILSRKPELSVSAVPVKNGDPQ